jgi:hypothetical protein
MMIQVGVTRLGGPASGSPRILPVDSDAAACRASRARVGILDNIGLIDPIFRGAGGVDQIVDF